MSFTFESFSGISPGRLQRAGEGRCRPNSWLHFGKLLSNYRSTINIRLLRSSKVSGSTIVSGVYCLVHDVNIRLLTFQFGRLIIGGCHAG